MFVKVAAYGVCHTDLHALNSDWPVKGTLPLIPGHEGLGTVVGADVTQLKEAIVRGRRGGIAPAGIVNTAAPAGKPYTRPSKTPAIQCQAATPSTCWPTPTTWAICPMRCRFSRLCPCCARA